MTRKRFSVWDDDPEELPVQFVDNDMTTPWFDLFWIVLAIVVIFGVGVIVGRWVV